MSSEMNLMEDRILASLRNVKNEITNETITSHNKILVSIQAVTDRFDALESSVADISKCQIELNAKLKKLDARVDDSSAQVAVQVDKKLRELREDVQEERRKMIRLCNVVLFGVPETTAGMEIASRMMSILLPDWTGVIDDDRIGSADSAKPRPLRLKLDNYHQKRRALASKRKLAAHPEFRGISVQPDMTKTEQIKSKEKSRSKPKSTSSASQLTSQTVRPSSSGVKTRAGTKRKSSSELKDSDSSKFGKGEDSIEMDD
jgi:hypothetical protein